MDLTEFDTSLVGGIGWQLGWVLIESGWINGWVFSILTGSIKNDGNENQELPNVLSRNLLSELSQETGWSDQTGRERWRNSFEFFFKGRRR